MGFLDFLKNLFSTKPEPHKHNWGQFSKVYWLHHHPQYKQRCSGCYRIRYVGTSYGQIERFTYPEAINDEILGFMRYAFKN